MNIDFYISPVCSKASCAPYFKKLYIQYCFHINTKRVPSPFSLLCSILCVLLCGCAPKGLVLQPDISRWYRSSVITRRLLTFQGSQKCVHRNNIHGVILSD